MMFGLLSGLLFEARDMDGLGLRPISRCVGKRLDALRMVEGFL